VSRFGDTEASCDVRRACTPAFLPFYLFELTGVTTMTIDLTRILILTTRDWFGSARLPAALARAGFEVASLAFPGALITQSSHVTAQFSLPSAAADLELLAALRKTLLAFAPALVVPGDDPAVELLHALGAEVFANGETELRACFERSLGDPRHYGKVQSRRELHAAAVRLGVRVPEQGVVTNAREAEAFAEQYGFPLILKAENTCAGFGTAICADPAALKAAFVRFDAGYGFARLPLAAITVQRFVQGRTAMRAIVASEGRVLAGLSAYKLETHPAPTGPSTVIEFFENQAMERAAVSVTESFGLSGFASFDFMIEDEGGAAYLIELNPRPVPICHLGGAFGDDLCGALWQRLNGTPPRSSLAPVPGRRVALFPQEWVRASDSPHLQQAFHDVPWDEPLLARALTVMGVEQIGWNHLLREERRREGMRGLAEGAGAVVRQ
jgi:carbamoyl-phosphate synthase large subunit